MLTLYILVMIIRINIKYSDRVYIYIALFKFKYLICLFMSFSQCHYCWGEIAHCIRSLSLSYS